MNLGHGQHESTKEEWFEFTGGHQAGAIFQTGDPDRPFGVWVKEQSPENNHLFYLMRHYSPETVNPFHNSSTIWDHDRFQAALYTMTARGVRILLKYRLRKAAGNADFWARVLAKGKRQARMQKRSLPEIWWEVL